MSEWRVCQTYEVVETCTDGKFEKRSRPSAYTRHVDGRSEVWLDVLGKWNAWAIPMPTVFDTAEDAMAAVDALKPSTNY